MANPPVQTDRRRAVTAVVLTVVGVVAACVAISTDTGFHSLAAFPVGTGVAKSQPMSPNDLSPVGIDAVQKAIAGFTKNAAGEYVSPSGAVLPPSVVTALKDAAKANTELRTGPIKKAPVWDGFGPSPKTPAAKRARAMARIYTKYTTKKVAWNGIGTPPTAADKAFIGSSKSYYQVPTTGVDRAAGKAGKTSVPTATAKGKHAAHKAGSSRLTKQTNIATIVANKLSTAGKSRVGPLFQRPRGWSGYGNPRTSHELKTITTISKGKGSKK